MKTENEAGIQKKKFRVALLSIISIVLLSVIFTAIWNTFMSPAAVPYQNESRIVSEKVDILNQDKLLHDGLKKLQVLDNNFALLLADSANKQKLDSLNELINNSQTSFGNTIDSIDSRKGRLSDSADVATLDRIISAFRIALNNQKSVGYMREALSGESGNVNENKRDLLKLQMELQNKDSKILALTDELKKAEKKPVDDFNKPENQEQIESLQSDIKTGNEKIATLTALNNSLTKDKSTLTQQINDLKTNTTSFEEQKKSERLKNESLQNKIDDLNANLILAKVDCNLSRADAKQIISNSKQRKDLLQESLNALNDLSGSDNTDTRRKVKEKLSQLQRIAATIRD